MFAKQFVELVLEKTHIDAIRWNRCQVGGVSMVTIGDYDLRIGFSSMGLIGLDVTDTRDTTQRVVIRDGDTNQMVSVLFSEIVKQQDRVGDLQKPRGVTELLDLVADSINLKYPKIHLPNKEPV